MADWNDFNNDGKVDWKDYVIMNDIAEMNKETNDDNSSSSSSHSPSSSNVGVPNVGICLVLGLILEAIMAVSFEWEIYDMSTIVVVLLWFLCSVIAGVALIFIGALFGNKR